MKTPIKSDAVLNELSLIARVFAQNPDLARWFAGLTHLSLVDRRNEIYRLSEKMRQNHEDTALVASFQLLADPMVFKAVLEILKK